MKKYFLSVVGAFACFSINSQTVLNGDYKWGMYTAAAAGGNGVGANAYEIWEYPDNTTSNCCRQRFVIKPSIEEDGSYQSVVIDAQGRVSIGGSTQGSHHLSVNGSM
jgi:hypothetical protein